MLTDPETLSLELVKSLNEADVLKLNDSDLLSLNDVEVLKLNDVVVLCQDLRQLKYLFF